MATAKPMTAQMTQQCEQVTQKLQAVGCPCDPAHVQMLAGFNFNFANLFLVAEKDGPLAAQIIKDIIEALTAA